MLVNGYVWHIILATAVTLKLAFCAVALGLIVGLVGAMAESSRHLFIRYSLSGIIFTIRALPELLVLFFIYFGLTVVLSNVFGHYINISPFVAGVIALGLIFGSYASHVFRGAFSTVETGQLEAGRALGLSSWQIFYRIHLPQAWRHALPGLSNLWLVLLKDTAIVTLIGLSDMMNEAKVAASSTHQPFTYFMIAAFIYLIITSISQILFDKIITHANRYVQP